MKSKIIFLNGESILVQQGDCIRSIDASGFTLEEKQLLHHHDGLSVGIAVAISHGKFFSIENGKIYNSSAVFSIEDLSD